MLPLPDFFSLFEQGRSLREVTTFGIGGTARYYIEVSCPNQFQQLIAFCYQKQLPYCILGKGSNLLFDDRGFPGVVIVNRIVFLNREQNHVWHVGAGYSFSYLGTQTAREGLSGLEFASGIPGSVGGAVFMNAGANGQDTSSPLLSVDYINALGQTTTLLKNEISFSYRFSSFHEQKGAIIGARFQLTPHPAARTKQHDLIHYRKETQPYKDRSAGCIFRNPPQHSAGKLIEQAGCKGLRIGDAEVSLQHANFIINRNYATAREVLELISIIQERVWEKSGIRLEREVLYIPFDSFQT